MKRKILLMVSIFISLFIVGYYSYKINTDNTVTEKETINEEKPKELETIKINISGNDYTVKLENNETAASFMNILPKEYQMREANGNQKYVYLEYKLPVNEKAVKQIETGDLMLDGEDCIILFYKSVKTSRKYTKIGHVEDLPHLGNSNITARFYLIK